MPSPGPGALTEQLAPLNFTVEGGYPTTIGRDWIVIDTLANAMHSGWTSATPTTVTTMATSMTAAFGSMANGFGQGIFTAMGTAIDAEVSLWAASWDAEKNKHTYYPSASVIAASAMAGSPIKSNAVTALSERVATVFVMFFEQEVG